MSGFLGPLLAADIQSLRSAGFNIPVLLESSEEKFTPLVKCCVPSIIQDKPFNLLFQSMCSGACSTSGSSSHVKEIITRPSFRLRKEKIHSN